MSAVATHRSSRWHASRAIASASVFVSLVCLPVGSTRSAEISSPSSSESEVSPPLDWPRKIERDKATILLYQPQLESLRGNQLTGRAAVSVTLEGQSEPAFGAVEFEARLETRRDDRSARIGSLRVPLVRFPGASKESEAQLARILEEEIVRWDIDISLDALLASLEDADVERQAEDEVKTDPPTIYFRTKPTVLVLLDGKPELRPVEGTRLFRVVNTPFFVVLEPTTKAYVLRGGRLWYTSKEVEGPWTVEANPPEGVVAAWTSAVEGVGEEGEDSGDSSETSEPAEILVSTTPAELILTDGAPTYSPLPGNDLLKVSNTESDLFVEIQTQKHFLLLSGRWYATESLEKGPWSYAPSDALPSPFAAIPSDGEQAHVLASVAGTPEAREAVLETYIPQTAAVNRAEARLEVTYDGDPRFEPIEGTTLQYAVNTGFSVIRCGSTFYCCDNGVWFGAPTPKGPWTICDSIPNEIYAQPPSSPVYTVKYVHVYHSTPTVVYVGYTPGYVGCYVYRGTVVYGTGYVYRGWCGAVYYPRPVTFGFSVRYNPWTGSWGFGFGVRVGGPGGWIAVGGSGWWGVGGYRRAHYGDVNIHIDRSTNVNINRPSTRDRRDLANNVYQKRKDLAPRPSTRPVTRPAVEGRVPSVATRPATLPTSTLQDRGNNVFTDREGNVYRRTRDGWEKREGSSWSSLGPAQLPEAQRPSTRPGNTAIPSRNPSVPQPATRPVPQPSRPTALPARPQTTRPQISQQPVTSLERQYQARQRGATRTQSYQQYRSTASARPAQARPQPATRPQPTPRPAGRAVPSGGIRRAP